MGRFNFRVFGAILVLSVFFVTALLTPPQAFAGSIEDEINELKARISELERRLADEEGKSKRASEERAEVKKVAAEASERRASALGKIAENIEFSGLVEVEVKNDNNDVDGESNGSDVTLATVELGFDADLNEYVRGHVLLLWEEGEESNHIIVDEGTIEVTSPYDLVLTAGKMYVPFGVFNSHFITDPLTLELAETNDSALMAGYEKGPLSFQVALFNGDADERGGNDIEDFVAYAELAPAEGVTVGAFYISDLAETDADITGRQEDGLWLLREVPGYGFFTNLEFGQATIELEYITAARHFKPADLDADDNVFTHEKPSAFNLEFAYAINEALEVAAKYEGSEDFISLPDEQYGLAVSYGIFENTALSLEYLEGSYDNRYLGGGDREMLTGQVAVEF